MFTSRTRRSAGSARSSGVELRAGAGAAHRQSVRAEIVLEQEPEIGLVVDDHDPGGAGHAAASRRCTSTAQRVDVERLLENGQVSVADRLVELGAERVAGDQDHATRQLGMVLAQGRDQRRAVQIGHAQVAHHHVERLALQSQQCLAARSRRPRRSGRRGADARPRARRSPARRRRRGRARAWRGGTRRGRRLDRGWHGRRHAAADTAKQVPCPGRAAHLDPAAVRGDDAEATRRGRRPVPTPCGLVVKNGSKIRLRTSSAMPGPLSSTSIATSEPRVAGAPRGVAAARSAAGPAGR